MILKEADKARLAEVTEVLNKLKLKFPVAEIARKTGEDKGNVSKILNGKLPISDNFYTTFMNTLGGRKDVIINSGFAGEEIIKLRKEIIELRAFVNVFLPVISKLSAKEEKVKFETRFGDLQKATDDEYDRLYMKFLKEQEREKERKK